MEYSTAHRVSLSTLRRRIKAGEIEYKLIEGKYLIRNGPLPGAHSGAETIAPPPSVKAQNQAPAPTECDLNDPFWKTTQGLLNEIKKAYSLILQEKEEQILQLKEEVADLKTLVRVLEDENNRLRQTPSGASPLVGPDDFDLGLEA